MVQKKHKVFISYHHDADQECANKLQNYYQDAIIDKSLYDDMSHLKKETILEKIRLEHLKDSTVTVVLVGKHTWGRKWVDWEIYSSLRPYGDRTRNGLVGIYLPGHSRKHFRLTDNIQSGYAIAIKWEEIDEKIIDAIHQAWNNRRRLELINNTRELRQRNAPLKKKQYTSTPDKINSHDDCFIATAAYGTPLASEINILRKWRDEKLQNARLGRQIITFYYRNSPPIADFIRQRQKLRQVARWIIGLFIKIIR